MRALTLRVVEEVISRTTHAHVPKLVGRAWADRADCGALEQQGPPNLPGASCVMNVRVLG